ncbi:helix-turn-helix domain-containing protein [Lactococcus protaetiae]|uniref:Helix-turn-helix transcriptional regulator n=1 Tax=Lactococcus protaetiae TaxID=2592653 RepID=A0A514Z7C8_9LACT|nr:helix-turn-helix transcriptional regulator [Lactococcus protaetiae]QDK70508.1 helix-turn-helix transcriptional regulator [Lactococcus protaetiae]
MTLFERIKLLAEQKRISLRTVAIELGLGENYLYSLKNKKPNADNLEKIADYFNTTTDYLLGRESITDEDLETKIDHAVMFGGKPLDDSDRKMFKELLHTYLNNKPQK